MREHEDFIEDLNFTKRHRYSLEDKALQTPSYLQWGWKLQIDACKGSGERWGDRSLAVFEHLDHSSSELKLYTRSLTKVSCRLTHANAKSAAKDW